MAKNYLYPRVSISTTALKHANKKPVATDTTILFAPLLTEKGPTDITPVHSLDEYTEIFGELSYEKLGQTALNVANWLTAGGTVYVYRLSRYLEEKDSYDTGIQDGIASGSIKYSYTVNDVENTSDENKITFTSKYPGEYYHKMTIDFDDDAFGAETRTIKSIIIKDKLGREVEKFLNVKVKEIKKVLNTSNYIHVEGKINADAIKLINDGGRDPLQLTSQFGNISVEEMSYVDALRWFWTGVTVGENSYSKLCSVINDRLATPIDVIMDAGYPQDVKSGMLAFIAGTDAVRPDIIGIFDTCGLVESEVFPDYKSTNIAVYKQSMIVEHNDEDIKVSPTYFLSSLIPANDLAYGIQWPTAGVRRGILSGVKKLSENPDPDTMDNWFQERYNYVQKTSREYAFMSQRTFDGSSDDEFTALSFLNNVRVLHKIRRDLEFLAREYLFQFNDAITLANMNEVLNKYMATWLANRTLASASVVATKSEYSDEAVNVNLTMKFTGTIEVISIDIIVE